MGKKRVIAETGAGQHGVATATAAALFGLSCTIYMGEEDTRRQALNVARMKLLGAEVVPVTAGSRTLEGRDQRSVPRLGHDRRRDALPLRHRRGPAPVSRSRSRLPEDRRRRSARAGDGVDWPPARRRHRMRRRRFERDRHLHRLPARQRCAVVRVRSRRRRRRDRQARSHAECRHPRRAARRTHLRFARCRRADARIALDLGRPRLPRRRP